MAHRLPSRAPRSLVWPLLIGAFALIAGNCPAAPALLDNWDEAPRSTALAIDGSPAFDALQERQAQAYRNRRVLLDFADAKTGAFSVGAGEPRAGSNGFAFSLGGAWGAAWMLTGEIVVSGWLRAPDDTAPAVALLDTSGGRLASAAAQSEPPDASGWRKFSAALPAVEAPVAVLVVTLDRVSDFKRVRIDGVEIRAGNARRGVTDRAVEDWVAQARATRPARVRSAVELGAKTAFSGRDRQIMDELWLGRDLAANNREFRKYMEEAVREGNVNHLPTRMRLILAYYQLGKRGPLKPTRLEPETERMILDTLWDFTLVTNDIATARQSSWWIIASENHDLNTKACALLSSRIFMNEPGYRDRIYPDLGRGPGFGHWKHALSASGRPHGEPTPGGNFKDGKAYNAADHYRAWLEFFHDYFAQRRTHGFFAENASIIYMKYTLGMVHALHAQCGDERLKREIGHFLDLVWADWAQHQLAGITGGSKTRHHHTVGGYDSMTMLARYFLGGPGQTTYLFGHQLFDDYQWPEVIWDLALDTRGRGSYAIQNRGIGEEEPIRPRPPGLERSILINPQSRLVKSAWVTPDYVLGTQMDHPEALHGQLNVAGRWQGLVSVHDPAVRIVTTSSAKANRDADMEILFQSVHVGSSLVTQQARSWHQIKPAWFGAPAMFQKPVAVYFGRAWDAKIERQGWIFVRKAGTFAAVRVLAGQRDTERRSKTFDAPRDVPVEGNPRAVKLVERPWTWSADEASIELVDMFSPIIIEAGRLEDYGSFERFQDAVFGSKVELLKTVVPGYYLVRYRGPAPGAPELGFNAATPDVSTIDGRPLNYGPVKAFDSPFVQSRADRSTVIRKGDRELILPAPIDPRLPSLIVVGDSTAAAAGDRVEGWGTPLPRFFDPARINVINRARGGRSSRTFITEGWWEQALARAKPGDLILIQFGHNDAGAINNEPPPPLRARGSLPGVGGETRAIDNALTGRPETVRTFGAYLREMVRSAQAKGARPILLSPTIRNIWTDGRVERGPGKYRDWTEAVARETGADFIDLSERVGNLYEQLGQSRVGAFFPGDHTHTNAAGAALNAEAVVTALRSLLGPAFETNLSPAGRNIERAGVSD